MVKKATRSLELNREELSLLASAINESLELVEDWEYSIRVGASKDEAKAMHARLSALISDIRKNG